MATILQRVFFLPIVFLAIISFPTFHSMAAELTPIQELKLCTWTKTSYPIEYEETFPIAENWKKLGMKVQVEPLNAPNPCLDVLFKTHEFDGFVVWFVPQMERMDPDFYTYNAFHSANSIPGGWNMAGFSNKEFDRLAELQRTEYDLDKRKVIIKQLQQILYRENPWIVMVNNDEFQAYNKVNFKDPIISKVGGFMDVFSFFTMKPAGDRKVIRLAEGNQDLKTINPLLSSEASQIRWLYFVYDMLLRIGPDTKPQLWAAAAVNPIDQTTINVTIRKDLKFHDGKPLTAEDVKFSYEFLIKHKAVYFRTALNPVESVDVIDTYNVKFHLKKPHAPFISQTLAMVPLLPKHVWENIEKPTEYRNVPAIGSGPFKFDHWREAQEIKVSRFADHFKPPYADGILGIFYGSREGSYRGLIQKEADVNPRLLAHQLDELKNSDYLQTVRVPSPGSHTLVLNCRRKPFDDPKFRLAMAYTIPRKQILEEYFNGYGNLGGSVIAPANEFWTDPSIKPYPFDLEKAKNILKEAGYSWDKNGQLCYPPN